VLLVAGEHAHLADEAGHVTGEDVGDEPAAGVGQGDRLIAAVVGSARPLHETSAQQVAHHHRGIRVAAQELLAEVALAEWPVVQEGFQRAELPDGEAGRAHDATHPRGERLRRAHELDVGVEGGGLRGAAGIACGHGSNSKRL
jgi:hypothetical protein